MTFRTPKQMFDLRRALAQDNGFYCTQEHLARILGVSRRSIINYEQRGVPLSTKAPLRRSIRRLEYSMRVAGLLDGSGRLRKRASEKFSRS